MGSANRKKMRVLILGGSGYIGRHLANRLSSVGIEYRCASRQSAIPDQKNFLVADTKNKNDLVRAMANIDIVVNCVAGDFNSISDGARCLVEAALESGRPLIVHMSSMAVYGSFEGNADEETRLDPSLGWYSRAKYNAELQISHYCAQGGRAVVLRPGCVYGPSSELWVGRIGRWLKAGRIGDIGLAGDGWSNLVHVDDVVSSIVSSFCIEISDGRPEVFNLAAPDSPRWNEYFVDLALTIQAVPVKRVKISQLFLDAYFYSPPAKLFEVILQKLKLGYSPHSNPLPPALLKFFKQQIRIDSSKAEKSLIKNWVSYHKAMNALSD